MSDPSQRVPRLSQVRALRQLGLDRAQRRQFSQGEAVVFCFATQAEPAIAMIQLEEKRVRSGIISIRDVAGGAGDFMRFRDRSQAVARAFDALELELFGAAVINQRLETLLLRQGFIRMMAAIPVPLGGGSMEILAKVFPVI